MKDFREALEELKERVEMLEDQVGHVRGPKVRGIPFHFSGGGLRNLFANGPTINDIDTDAVKEFVRDVWPEALSYGPFAAEGGELDKVVCKFCGGELNGK